MDVPFALGTINFRGYFFFHLRKVKGQRRTSQKAIKKSIKEREPGQLDQKLRIDDVFGHFAVLSTSIGCGRQQKQKKHKRQVVNNENYVCNKETLDVEETW